MSDIGIGSDYVRYRSSMQLCHIGVACNYQIMSDIGVACNYVRYRNRMRLCQI